MKCGGLRAIGSGSRGITLLELIIALTVGVVVVGAIVGLGGSTQKVWDTVSSDCDANYDLRRAAERVADELRQSTSSRVTVQGPSADADTVTFQVPVGKAQDVVLWGAEGDSGGYVQFVVENGQLIRRVLNASMVSAGRDQVLVTQVDSSHGGEKGFHVSVEEGMAEILVRAVVRSNGETWRKEARTSVLFRNQ